MTGSEVSMTGKQVKAVRTALGESQAKFAARLAVSQPVIHRLEKRGGEVLRGPEIILIHQIAVEHGLIRDPAGAVAA
ncbi:helix-turn-helix domain-containing protein [Jiella avicenniae]|uniref:Helix-turn-helix domain-containing protein n=1 Tax=Jiella avicenniae TaxID=2907202 RepID=A0A9X1P1M3_9HYPH|nr:hypothetical protein [Jiella avicenniae]MCE7028441.1 hypothetical protein [Jiella avicenniae]